MYMGISIKIIEAISLVMLALIIIIVLLTYILNLKMAYTDKNRKKMTEEVENYFKKLIESNQTFDYASFPTHLKQIRIVYTVFARLDKIYADNAAWQKNRMAIIQSLLVPLARKYGHSQLWIKRFFVTEIFALKAEKQDEKIIIRLTEDRVPLVFFHSISAAIACESELAINNVIDRLAKVGWVTQLLYVEPFKNASPVIRQFVENRLKVEKESYIRAACYKILMQFPPSKVEVIRSDLDSDNFELRLATLKYLVYSDQEKAVPYLIEKLKDPHWELRLKAVHRLGAMRVESALTQIAECLDDADWWVKMSAAESLKSLGEKGKAILNERAPDLADIPFDATKHVSHTLW